MHADRICGGCLCGAVRLDARAPRREIVACHCVQCQRWTGGGPLFTVRVEDVHLTGTAQIASYNASEWGERSFCRDCGAPLYWRMTGKAITSIAAGLLDDQAGFTVSEEIFADRRPDWLPHWPDAAQSTEAQELAKLSRALEGDKS